MFLSKATINILLFITVCILAFGAWIGQTSEQIDDGPHILSLLSPQKVTRIEISDTKETKAILEKHQGKWFMSYPIKMQANAFLATRVSKILSVDYSRSFTLDDKNLLQFGLAPAVFTLQLNDHKVFFGQRNSISNQRYVRYNDKLLLIRDQLLPLLNSAPASFVSHKIIPGGTRITAVELADFSVNLKDNIWVMTPRNTQQQFSQDRFIKFIDEWRLAQALYISLLDKPSRYDKKIATSTIHLADGNRIQLTLSEDKSGLVLYRSDLGIQYHMHNEVEKSLFSFPELEQ